MTGKEALKQLEEKYHKYIIEWYYMSNMSKEKRDRLYKMYDEEIKIIDNELTKYKRAFEILKPIINMDNNIEDGGKEYWLSDIWGLRKLTKEEYELLEELMKDE